MKGFTYTVMSDGNTFERTVPAKFEKKTDSDRQIETCHSHIEYAAKKAAISATVDLIEIRPPGSIIPLLYGITPRDIELEQFFRKP